MARITSPEWRLRRQDVERTLHHAFRFLIPLALLYLAFVITGVEGGIELSDFVPNNSVLTAGVLFVLNALFDLLTRLKNENTY